MRHASVRTVASAVLTLALCGAATANGLDYTPPGAAYSALKNQMEDKRNLVNGIYNQTHIRSTIKKSMRDADVGAFSFTGDEDDDGVDGPVVNGVLVAPTATVEGDLNVFIDLDGDTLVLTE